MEVRETADNLSARDVIGARLERQLQLAEKRYADARDLVDKTRAELRALMTQAMPRLELIDATRGKLEAVAARCGRLYAVIDDLEAKLES